MSGFHCCSVWGVWSIIHLGATLFSQFTTCFIILTTSSSYYYIKYHLEKLILIKTLEPILLHLIFFCLWYGALIVVQCLVTLANICCVCFKQRQKTNIFSKWGISRRMRVRKYLYLNIFFNYSTWERLHSLYSFELHQMLNLL